MPTILIRPASTLALYGLALCGLALLPGCGQKTEASQPPPRPAAAVTPANAPLTPSGAPKRRAGWWSFAMAGDSVPRNELCVGEASERKYSTFDQIADPALCSKREFHRAGPGWAFSNTCDFGGGPVTAQGTITGDLTSHYTIAQTVSSDAADVTTNTLEARWTGPCPAGKKDGDMVANGTDTSVLGG